MRYRRLNSVLLATVLLLSIGVAYAARVTSSERHAQWPFQSEPRKVYACLRSAAVLTGSYVDTSYIDLRECKQIWLGFNITQGSLTKFQYKVWQSYDGITWYQEAGESYSSGVTTDAAMYYEISLSDDVVYYKIVPFDAIWLKLQVKGVGTATGSSCAVYVVGRY